MNRGCPLKYLGIPYLIGGDDFQGCDCWGLIRLFYRCELGVKLPAYTDFTQTTPFTWVDMPSNYDVVLIANNNSGIINHCALYTGGETILHSLENTGTVSSKVKVWRHKVRGYYRLKSNTGGNAQNFSGDIPCGSSLGGQYEN